MQVGVLSWPSTVSPSWLIGLRYGNIYSFGLYSRLLIRIIYYCQVRKLMSPGPQFNHRIQMSRNLPKGQRGSSHPHLQSHRQSEVFMLGFDLCLMIQENGLTYDSLSHSVDQQCQMDLEESAIYNDHPPILKKKKFFLPCTGQLRPIPAIISSLPPYL